MTAPGEGTEADLAARLAAAERELAGARARLAELEAGAPGAARADLAARLAEAEAALERCQREQRLGLAVERVRAEYVAELESTVDRLEGERPVSARLLAGATALVAGVRRRATVRTTLAAVAAALVVVRLVAIGGVDVILMWDEVGYLGAARHLAGSGPEVVMTGSFYPVGASLLLVPLAWLTSSPGGLHQAGVLLNIALLALLPFVHYGLLRRFGASTRAAVAGAAVASVLVSLTVQAASTWAETPMAVLVPLWLLAVSGLRRDGPWWAPGAVAVTAVAAYAVHGRGVALLVATAVVLAALPVLGRARPGPLAAGVAAGLVALVAVRALNSAVADALYLASSDGAVGGFLGRLRLDDVGSYARVAVGQSWYALVASLGLVVPGALVVVHRAWRHRADLRQRDEPSAAGGSGATGLAVVGGAARPDPLLPVALVVVALGLAAISMGTIGTGIARMSRGVVPAVRSDLMVYGRYLDQVVVLLAAVGAAWLVDRPARRVQAVVAGGAAAAVVVAGAVVARSFPAAWFGELFNPTSSPALFGWIEQVGSFSPLRVSLVVAVVVGAVLAARGRLVPAGLGLVVVVNLALVAVLVDRYVEPLARNTRGLAEVPAAVNRAGVTEVAILAPYDDGAFFKYQFWLERAGYRLVDVDDLDPEATPLVIGPVDWDLAGPLDATLVASDPGEGRALWALGPLPPDP